MKEHTKINLTQLVQEIRHLKPRQKLYIVLKKELQKIGHWKDRRRGDAAKAYATMKRNSENRNNKDDE